MRADVFMMGPGAPSTNRAAEANDQPFIMMREFRDGADVEWKVFEVYPRPREVPDQHGDASQAVSDRLRVLIQEGLAEGWLCFMSNTQEKRRLAPIPSGWEHATNVALQDMCRRAELVVRET
jgi:hypothetical protein